MGKRIRYSNGRRLVDDVIRLANRFPSAGLRGAFDNSPVVALRRKTRPKIAWNVIFMKAFAIMAEEKPALRQMYVGLPWPHLYEHDGSVCMMTLSREYQGEERLFFARFNNPQHVPLAELQERYDYFRRAPIEEIRQFRHQVNFAKCPFWLRRFAYWMMMNWMPKKRAANMGTFGISFSGHKGAFGTLHLGPVTTILGVDPFPRKGISQQLLTFDHRVMDGVPATVAFQQLQTTVNEVIRDELAAMVDGDGDRSQNMKAA